MGWLAKLLGVEHTAELRGRTIEFCSSGSYGSHMLWSDAVQACKDAGIFKSGDADRIIVDGKPNRWFD